MTITINEELSLQLLNAGHAQELYELAESNREYLARWLTWLPYMENVGFIENFIIGSKQRNKEGNEFAFVIIINDSIIGRIGIFKIDHQSKIGEIGYWIGKDFEGRGIAKKCCQKLIEYGFNELNLNRIEMKCGVDNHKSRYIPEKLNFTLEGILRQAE